MTMLQVTPADTSLPTARSYVDWGAIIAGTVIATSISLVLNGFGSAVGLSMTSALPGRGAAASTIGIAGGLWVMAVAIISLVAGAYVTGRMRRRADDATLDEVATRDGAHGLVVWALSALLGAMIAASGMAMLGRTAAQVASTAAPAVAAAAGNATEYAVDGLVRNETRPQALDDGTRQEIMRLVGRATTDGQIAAQDRTYLTQVLASRAGLEPAEVERRIDAFSTQARATMERAREAADQARRYGVLVAFLTAASFAVAAVGAWWGAGLGGRHRDENTLGDVVARL